MRQENLWYNKVLGPSSESLDNFHFFKKLIKPN